MMPPLDHETIDRACCRRCPFSYVISLKKSELAVLPDLILDRDQVQSPYSMTQSISCPQFSRPEEGDWTFCPVESKLQELCYNERFKEPSLRG